MPSVVYLAGQVVERAKATEWREYAAVHLVAHGFEVYDGLNINLSRMMFEIERSDVVLLNAEDWLDRYAWFSLGVTYARGKYLIVFGDTLDLLFDEEAADIAEALELVTDLLPTRAGRVEQVQSLPPEMLDYIDGLTVDALDDMMFETEEDSLIT